jgi:hypothetical protein
VDRLAGAQEESVKELQGYDLHNPENWTASTHEADWHIVSTRGDRSEVWAQCQAAAVIHRDLQGLLALSSEGITTVGNCTDSFMRILDLGNDKSRPGDDSGVYTSAQRLALLHLTQEMRSLQVNLADALARATRLASKMGKVSSLSCHEPVLPT